MEFTITKAAHQDRQAILDLSSHFTDDYLEYAVDYWMSQEKGGLYLVWDGDNLVACCSLYFPTSYEAWLQGMRVHPDYQNRGIAYQLNKHLIEQAKTEGAAAIRLLTSEHNHPAMKVAQKLGFSPTGGRREIIFRKPLLKSYKPGEDHTCNIRPCLASELSRAAYFLDDGPLFHNLQGYLFGPRYSYRRLTKKDLEEGIHNQQVYLLEEKSQVSGLLFIFKDKEQGHINLSYLDTPLEQLPSLLPLFNTWSEESYHQFTINLLAEQHRVLKPALEKLFGNYEYEQWRLMEKSLV